jgi:hypothetical protein
MKKIIEAIKAFFSTKPAATYAEVKKESIEEIYKLEPKAEAVEEKPKKAPAKKKKPATKKKKDGSK